MMPTETASVLTSIIGLFLIWYVCCFCAKEYLLDAFREELFTLRDELFNYIGSINVPFDDERHMILRNVINIMIRFSHKLTFFRVVLTQVSKTRFPAMYQNDPFARWIESLNSLPSDQKQELLALQARILRAALLQMVWRSPFLIPIVIVYKLGVLFSAATFGPLKRVAYQRIQQGLIEQQTEEQEFKADRRGRLVAV